MTRYCLYARILSLLLLAGGITWTEEPTRLLSALKTQKAWSAEMATMIRAARDNNPKGESR